MPIPLIKLLHALISRDSSLLLRHTLKSKVASLLQCAHILQWCHLKLRACHSLVVSAMKSLCKEAISKHNELTNSCHATKVPSMRRLSALRVIFFSFVLEWGKRLGEVGYDAKV